MVSADPGNELSIQRITPHGENISQAQQIVIEFNQPVVPLGDMKRNASELPITITPALNCQWRWMDTRSLVCQLDAKDRFIQATEYSVNITPGIKTEAGLGMRESYKHVFTTERPQVRSSRFITWLSPVMPVMRVKMNMPVTKRSLEKSLSFIGEDFDIAIKAELDPNYTNKDATDLDTQQTWLIKPIKNLPKNDVQYLEVSPGLQSDIGSLAGNEERELNKFHTFPDFKFLGVRCYSRSESKQISITETSSYLTCSPESTIYLSFTSPVSFDELKNNMIVKPDLANGRKDYDPWAGRNYYTRLDSGHYEKQTYEVYLPEFLQAYQNYQFSGKDIKDEFGRSLVEPFVLSFMTEHRQPNLNIPNSIAVLEKNIDSKVPVFVTNIDSMNISYSATTANNQKPQTDKEITFPIITDIAFAQPLPYRELLDNESGVISGYVTQEPNPNKYQPRSIFAQVTPFQVQAKLGHFSSLVWVTDMATGEPVANAEVSIYPANMLDPTKLDSPQETVITDAQGLANLQGLEDLDPTQDLIHQWKFEASRLMVQIKKDDDIAILPISDDFTVWGRDVYPWNKPRGGYIKAWGTTAQGVYKPGDTIQYKIYARNENVKTLVKTPEHTWSLKITDPTGKVIDEVDGLELNKFGAFDSEVFIPKGAAVGWYNFTLTAPADERNYGDINLTPITVLISDFTPAPFKVSTDLNGKIFEPGDELVVSTSARLHAGGPYTSAQTSVRADLNSGYFRSKHALAKKFQFDTQLPETPSSTSVFHKQEMLNDKGDLETKFTLEDKNIIYGTLRVESSVRDDRGKSVAKMSTAKFFARDQLVGLKNTQWVYQQDEESEVQYMVVDQQGEPIADTPVSLKIERQETKASRVKSAGNAYVTQYITNWVASSECTGNSAIDPAPCLFTPSEPGSYRITATIKDSKQREHRSQIHAWVVGKGQVMWEQATNNNLSIIPENETPKIGDTVRYLVKNPFPGGKALISIERYGVIKSWVEDFDDSTEIIEFPVEPDFMPGFYLSVSVFSPRVDKPLGDGNVDLGKPTFSLGYVRVPVTDPYKQIDVEVSSNAETFQPNENVKLSFSAKPKHDVNNAAEEPIELAIVVIDEAVFDLIKQGERYFDPYKGFYALGSLDVANYSLINRLVGRQKFEAKGANTGGDGGGEEGVNFRSIEKYIAYWNPSLVLKPDETKSISFKAPDNLTGWRVFAMAVTKADRLGLGKNGFKVNKEVELRPVMPNQVMQGDQFDAGFSVMNRTDTVKEIKVVMKASGSIAEDLLIRKTISVEPYKRETVWMPIKTKSSGEIKLTASAIIDDETTKANDGLSHTLPILRRDIFETAAVYGTFDDAKATTSILFPEQIHNDVGELSVTVSPSVISNVEGAFKYMRDYPYQCWEQRLSKGVMAEHFNNLKDYMPENLKWANSKNLSTQMLQDAANFQAPNGGMTFWTARDEYVNPYLSAYTALAFNWLESTEQSIPTGVESKLHNYLERILKRDAMPSYYGIGMKSTVRAVALSALSAKGKITLADLERYREHVPQMSLFGKSQYLIAANRIKGAEEIVTEVTHMILAKSVQSAGKFQFNESSSSDYQRILETPTRTQCSILSAFTATAKTPEGKKLVADVPFKVVRAITQGRGKRDHWENTQENLFCMNALSEYSRVYEAEIPAMLVKATLNDELLGASKFSSKRDPDMKFAHAINENDPGRKTTVKIEKEGPGRVYYTTRMQYAPLESVAERVHSGIEIRREYSVNREEKWVLLESPMQVKRGELVKVDLFLHLPAVRNFVVVDDPVPGGLEPVNRDLATSSVMDAEAGETKAAEASIWFERDDWLSYNYSYSSFYHKELRHDSVRFYSDYLTPGHYHLSYTAQAIATGEFSVLPSQSEEMYDPDVYGRSLPARLIISE